MQVEAGVRAAAPCLWSIKVRKVGLVHGKCNGKLVESGGLRGIVIGSLEFIGNGTGAWFAALCHLVLIK